MFGKHKRLRAIVAVVALAASMILTQAAFSTAAQARCAGETVEVTSLLRIAGTTYVTEVPVSGTCQGNNTYQSEFRSNVPGWRASVLIQNNGIWARSSGGYNTAWAALSYADNNSNSLIVLCADDGTTYYCGYLDTATISDTWTYNYSRLNHGF